MWNKFSMLFALCAVFVLTSVCCVNAQIPIRLYNTGVDDNNQLLTPLASDPHYTLIKRPGMASIQANAYVAQQVNSWLSPGPFSQWIVPDLDGAHTTNAGTFVYRTTFDLSGFNPSAAVIMGKWSTDNNGVDILINGTSTGFTSPDGQFATGYSSFTINKGFVSGVNTLDFVVNNSGGPTALRIELSGTVTLPAINGKLKMQGVVCYAGNQNITFTARPANGGDTITQVLSVPPAGNFSLTGLAFALYTIHIKGDKYLATNVSADTTGGSISGVTATLLAGDSNNDNRVNIGDFGILVGAYGSDASDPTSGYNAQADLNGDGKVDLADFSLIVANYETSGDL